MSDPIQTIQKSKLRNPGPVLPACCTGAYSMCIWDSNSIGPRISLKSLQIQTGLQNLRLEREVCESDINSLMHEKESIRQVLPKILEKLKDMKEGINTKQAEMGVLDRAIEEIERQYGHVLFTSAFYSKWDFSSRWRRATRRYVDRNTTDGKGTNLHHQQVIYIWAHI